MKPPVIAVAGIPADWNAIGKSMRAANDPDIAAVQEWEDEGGSVRHLETPPTKPPAKRD
ncbi:MAG TPA: hypothetical protein VLA30_07510 [Burkholderiales bacterium]|nr:hypothetical protein [Burkholderiales bacterium]